LVLLARPEEFSPAMLAELDATLDSEDRTYTQRFLGQRRTQAVVGRCLARLALGKYFSCSPGSWRFGVDPMGKPVVVSPLRGAAHFNISHTTGLVACAAASSPVGLDVEDSSRELISEAVATAVLAPAELAGMGRLPQPSRQRQAYRLWALKEAYVKGIGIGLRAPAAEIGFDLQKGRPRLNPGAPGTGEPNTWSFWSLEPTRSHVLALALKDGGAGHEGVRIEWVCPSAIPAPAHRHERWGGLST